MMSDMRVGRVRTVTACVALVAAGASAANYWLDQNGTVVGFGVADLGSYDWTAAGVWNTNALGGGTDPLVAWPGGSNQGGLVGAGDNTTYTVRLGAAGDVAVTLQNFGLNWDFATATPMAYGNAVIGAPGDTGVLTLNANNSFGTAAGKLTVNNPINLGARTSYFRGGTVVVNGVVSGTGKFNFGSAAGLSAGILTLANEANTFSGRVVGDYINANYTLAVTKLADGGNPSSIGTSSANIGINGGTLRFIGTGAQSTTLGFQMASAGCTVDASGPTDADTITFSGAPTYSAVNSVRALTLSGANTGNNTIAFDYGNNGTAANTLTKNGAGRWILTGNNTFTGTLTVNAGTLVAASASAFGAAGRIVTVGAATTTGTVEFATDSTVNAWVINLGSGNSGAVVVNRATSGETATHTMGTATLGNGLLSVLKGGNVTGTPTLEFTAINLSAGVVGLGTVTLNPTTARIAVLGGIARPGVQANSLTLDGTIDGNSIAGVISGALTLDKNNISTWTLSGENTFTGTTTVNGGTLVLNNNLALQNSAFNTAGAGTLDLSAVNTPTFGGLTGAIDYSLPAHVTTLTLNPQAGTATFSGNLVGGAAGLTLTKTGAGTQVLAGNNTYSGLTTVNGGELRVQSAGAIGGAAITVSSGRLVLSGGVTAGSGKTITVNGNGVNYWGALQGSSGDNEWQGGVTVGPTADTRIGVDTGTFTVSGVIDGSTAGNGVTFRPNTGTLVLSGANTYLGDTTIIAGGGKVQLAGGANRLPVGTRLRFGGSNVSGILDLNGQTQEVAGLSVVSGTANWVTNGAAVASTFTVNTADGSPSTYSGRLGGPLALAKAGASALTLSGANTHSGGTTVQAGTLALSGAGTLGGGDVAVAAGATLDVTGATGGSFTLGSGQTLKGNGTVSGGLIMGSGSTLSPGFSTGTNVFSGPLTLSGNTSTFELASATDYDQVIVAGGSLTLQSSPVLSLLTGGLVAGAGAQFTLFDNQFGGAVVLTSNFLLDGGGELADGATFTVGAHQFEIDYEGGDGNDVTLTVVPEPASLGLVGAVLLAALLRRRTH
jgi:autotransporter-associated beta strand protein